MSMTTTAQAGIDLRAIAASFAPGSFRFDPFGLVSGYKAYLIYTGLDAKSDSELAEIGLSRRDLPRAAMTAANVLRTA